MITLAQDVVAETASFDLTFIEDAALEYVGGGTITNTL
jgi:hypothetical protein